MRSRRLFNLFLDELVRTILLFVFVVVAEADAPPGGDAAPGGPGGRKLSAHEEILALRKRLPVFKYRKEFLEAVRDHQVPDVL